MKTKRHLQALALVLAFVATLVAACSLNPQPIPPGAEDDGGARGSDATAGDNGGGSQAVDGEAPAKVDDGGSDAPTGVIGNDAGDAGPDADLDAGDASD